MPPGTANADDGTCRCDVELAVVDMLGGKIAEGRFDADTVGDDAVEDIGVPGCDGIGEIEIVLGTVSG